MLQTGKERCVTSAWWVRKIIILRLRFMTPSLHRHYLCFLFQPLNIESRFVVVFVLSFDAKSDRSVCTSQTKLWLQMQVWVI